MRYRYYVSCALEEGRREEAGTVARVPAPEIEQAVLGALGEIRDGEGPTDADATRLATCVGRVEVHPDRLVIQRVLDSPDQPPPENLIVPWSARSSRRRREVIPMGGDAGAMVVMRSETRARLVEGIAQARLWLDELLCGRVQDTAEIAHQEDCSERSVRMTLNLAFLAPD
ncbi:hypothetical protein U8607_23660 [Methylobacterium durans]|uniref:hypothetical protein n=1 Tax=Methylobacterium durans TaxID=2202825 RepID=UPI002AFEB3DA|nr:hypothetical protein [Methylobacterium durans]MEA1835091.1 hypothetical protein [Methylobacterium durans]